MKKYLLGMFVLCFCIWAVVVDNLFLPSEGKLRQDVGVYTRYRVKKWQQGGKLDIIDDELMIYAVVKKSVSENEISACLKDFYADSPFIRLYDYGIATDTANVRGTNFCDIGFVLEKSKNRLVIMSVIDNLVKGAAGQAVQNMNIMLGLDETTGLKMMPYPV